MFVAINTASHDYDIRH